jgi:hypothetical protein
MTKKKSVIRGSEAERQREIREYRKLGLGSIRGTSLEKKNWR